MQIRVLTFKITISNYSICKYNKMIMYVNRDRETNTQFKQITNDMIDMQSHYRHMEYTIKSIQT